MLVNVKEFVRDRLQNKICRKVYSIDNLAIDWLLILNPLTLIIFQELNLCSFERLLYTTWVLFPTTSARNTGVQWCQTFAHRKSCDGFLGQYIPYKSWKNRYFNWLFSSCISQSFGPYGLVVFDLIYYCYTVWLLVTSIQYN